MSVVIAVSKGNRCIGSVQDVRIGTAPGLRRQYCDYRNDEYVACDAWLLKDKCVLNHTPHHRRVAVKSFLTFVRSVGYEVDDYCLDELLGFELR